MAFSFRTVRERPHRYSTTVSKVGVSLSSRPDTCFSLLQQRQENSAPGRLRTARTYPGLPFQVIAISISSTSQLSVYKTPLKWHTVNLKRFRLVSRLIGSQAALPETRCGRAEEAGCRRVYYRYTLSTNRSRLLPFRHFTQKVTVKLSTPAAALLLWLLALCLQHFPLIRYRRF